jgi:hypothetical protein
VAWRRACARGARHSPCRRRTPMRATELLPASRMALGHRASCSPWPRPRGRTTPEQIWTKHAILHANRTNLHPIGFVIVGRQCLGKGTCPGRLIKPQTVCLSTHARPHLELPHELQQVRRSCQHCCLRRQPCPHKVYLRHVGGLLGWTETEGQGTGRLVGTEQRKNGRPPAWQATPPGTCRVSAK